MDPRAICSENATTYSLWASQSGQFVNDPSREGAGEKKRRSDDVSRGAEREKTSERIKYLQRLVPGCDKVNGSDWILDDTIMYLQSLQRQVEFLSLKLAVVGFVPREPSKEEASVKWIEPRSFSSQSMESLPLDETYKDEGESFDIDPLNLEQTLEDAMKQNKGMLCPEKDKFSEEASVKWIEPLSFSSQSMESLPLDETYKDVWESFDIDPLNLEQTLEEAMKQKKGMLCPEKDKFSEEASVKWIEPLSFSSRSMESLPLDETYKDVWESLDIDPLNLEQTLEEAMKQKKGMLCPEKDKFSEEASVKWIGPLSFSSQSMESLPVDETCKDVGESFNIDPLNLEQTLEEAMKQKKGMCPEKDKFSEEASVKWIEPLSFSFQSMESLPLDETYKDVGDSFDIDPLNLEQTLEEAMKQKKGMLCPEKVYELVEVSPVEDVVFSMTAEPHLSCFQSIKSLPRQESEENTIVLDPSAQILILEDAPQIQNKCLIVGVEKADAGIHFVKKTCEEVTSEIEKNSEEDISFESLTKHFGRPLDDAAKSFGVSRSKFKRICRSHGIKRWQSGKRRICDNISSKLERILNDEVPSKINFSCSGLQPVQDTIVDANTIQETNKMTVKAMYNGVAIRFELPDLSGIAELEDNVIERLQLDRKSFSVKYQDDEGDWTLITCDKDVRECMELSRSLKKTPIKLLLDPPINYCAP